MENLTDLFICRIKTTNQSENYNVVFFSDTPGELEDNRETRTTKGGNVATRFNGNDDRVIIGFTLVECSTFNEDELRDWMLAEQPIPCDVADPDPDFDMAAILPEWEKI